MICLGGRKEVLARIGSFRHRFSGRRRSWKKSIKNLGLSEGEEPDVLSTTGEATVNSKRTGVTGEYEHYLRERLPQAQLVPFRRVSFSDGSTPEIAKCHRNVDRYVQENPGTRAVRGWVTLVNHQVSMKFAAHSVIRDANGTLFDITPLENEYYRPTMSFIPHIGDEREFFLMSNVIDIQLV